MRRSALLKDTFREIKGSFSRFFSILVIIALGVSFFVGIKSTGWDMKITGDTYFNEYNLMDFRLVSPVGFTADDVKAVKKAEGVAGVMPGYSIDTLTRIRNKDAVIRVQSLPLEEVNRKDSSYINRPNLIQGRYPEKEGEALADNHSLDGVHFQIGSTVKLTSGTEDVVTKRLKQDEYTIVGIIETPYYVSKDRGNSPIGSGKVSSFLLVPETDFQMPVYNDLFVTVKGAKTFSTYSDSYDDAIASVRSALKDVGEVRQDIRYNEVVREATKQLDEKKKAFADGKEKQRLALEDGKAKMDAARTQLAAGEKALSDKEVDFKVTTAVSQQKLVDGKQYLALGEKQYAENLALYHAQKESADQQIATAQQILDNIQSKVNEGEKAIEEFWHTLQTNPNLTEAEKEKLRTLMALQQTEVQNLHAQFAKVQALIDEKKNELQSAKARLNHARQQLDDTKVQLENGEKQLQTATLSGQNQLDAGRAKLEKGKLDLADKEKQYDEQKKKAEEQLVQAKRQLDDAEKKIKNMPKPQWFVMDRTMNPGFSDYEEAANRMDAIAKVFPIFFFAIAAMICLTTMTRMVDEQRTYIGTVKALGYGKWAIASKYLIYAILASVGGSIIGVLVGFSLFPIVISKAYTILYIMPDIITAFNGKYVLLSTSLAVGITTIAAGLACYKELMITPAILMRPKAPKPGKRVLLERIPFIWKRLDFTQKVTARNMLRYKKRFFLTVFGVGGCTALIVSGFGLKDSILSIATKQFDDIYMYNMQIDMQDGVESEADSTFVSSLSKEKRISNYMLSNQQNMDAGAEKSGVEKSVSLFVPESNSKIEEFIKLRVRTTGESIPLTDEGVVLTEKLATQLKVNIGDAIYLKDSNNKKVSVKVTGITEQYVSRFVYMSPTLYKEMYGDTATFKQVLTKNTGKSDTFERELSTDLLKNKEARAITFTTGISKNFKDVISSLDYIVAVLIISAGVLAFVVLYNLTNVNVSERVREIATIKVLGFYNREVSSYIYRENIIGTLIGTAIGLIGGIFLHRYIVVTAEVDMVMFGREIKGLSYVLAAGLTILFSLLVNVVMYFRLKKIDMVDSLKSVD